MLTQWAHGALLASRLTQNKAPTNVCHFLQGLRDLPQPPSWKPAATSVLPPSVPDTPSRCSSGEGAGFALASPLPPIRRLGLSHPLPSFSSPRMSGPCSPALTLTICPFNLLNFFYRTCHPFKPHYIYIIVQSLVLLLNACSLVAGCHCSRPYRWCLGRCLAKKHVLNSFLWNEYNIRHMPVFNIECM